MILEAVPALPAKHPNGHHVIKRASRHYAGALGYPRGGPGSSVSAGSPAASGVPPAFHTHFR